MDTRSWDLFFSDTATTESYPLSLHDALPISISMSLSHCIHQTLNSKASTRFHSGGFAIQQIGRAVQQECRDRARMPSSAGKKKSEMSSLMGTIRAVRTISRGRSQRQRGRMFS